ncbi:hypothetical protein MRX96_039627 [Rhipicephalus microplus]
MLALDLQPYSCVDNRGFKELMNHMEPLYKILSRTTFSRTITRSCSETQSWLSEGSHLFGAGYLCDNCAKPGTTAHKERVSSIWDSIEQLAASSEKRSSTEKANIEEFNRYHREHTCSKDEDPLAFWKETGKQHFPHGGRSRHQIMYNSFFLHENL